jgi:hypothetical protein
MDKQEKQRYKETITPAKAAELLADNDKKLAEYGLKQRSISRARVESHKTEMLRGMWKWGIGAIHLAPNGAVLNGMHTLLGITESGVTIVQDVWRNCDPSEMALYDNAVSARSLKEILEMRGEENAELKAKVLPKIVAYNHGVLAGYSVRAIPPEEIIQQLDDERYDIEEAISFSKDAEYRNPTVGLMHYVYSRAGLLQPVLPFLSSFKDGAELKAGSLGLRFRSYVLGQGRELREKKLNAVFFRTLNAVIEGKDVGNFGHVKTTALRPTQNDPRLIKKQKKVRRAV